MNRSMVPKKVLRACARAALEDQGYKLEIFRGPGLVEGARLVGTVGSRSVRVSVRTSQVRELGLLRNPNGSWRVATTVDELVLAVPAQDDDRNIEIFCFSPDTLLQVFNAALKRKKGKSDEQSWKAPVFVALDGAATKGSTVESSLGEKALWRKVVPRSAAMRIEESHDPLRDLFDRVRQEVAVRNGVDMKDVTVKVTIASRQRNK